MAYYRKVPVVIEAVQWFKDGDHPEVFVHTAGGQVWVNGQSYIQTRDVRQLVMPGDWIIKNSVGEFSVCKAATFAATYVEA